MSVITKAPEDTKLTDQKTGPQHRGMNNKLGEAIERHIAMAGSMRLLSAHTGLDTQEIYRVVYGKSRVTPKIAVALSKYGDLPAIAWMQLSAEAELERYMETM